MRRPSELNPAAGIITRVAERFDGLPTWGLISILSGAILITSLAYLWPAYSEFPMDDTYIHFVYAQNLAENGKLVFNPAGDKGVGTTSILWVLLLAGGIKTGFSINLVAKILGILSLAGVGASLYLLLRSIWRGLPAFVGALLVAVSGNMVWFALSGMDTMLFLALGMLALLAYREERWGWLGVAVGLLTLTRPEGLALGAAVGLVEVLRHRRITRGLVVSGLFCMLVCGPWFGYLLARTSHILPTSITGKHLTNAIALSYLLQKTGAGQSIGQIPGLIYSGAWVGYLLEFTLGGMSLPGPAIQLGNVAGNAYKISVWAIPAWGLVFSLMLAATRKFDVIRRGQAWIHDTARRPVLVLLTWICVHNLSYMVFLPVPGTASRYGALNHIVLWLVLVKGLTVFANWPRLLLGMAGGLFAIAAANTLFWNGVYDANLEHMQRVRIEAAYFVRDAFRSEENCAAYDIGAIRYFSQRPIMDLGGLVNPDAADWYLKGSFDRYLVINQITCLALPGRSGVADEGWFDIAGMMGLTNSPLFKMERVNVFEIDRERWLQGYLPTGNYQASVAIYRLKLK